MPDVLTWELIGKFGALGAGEELFFFLAPEAAAPPPAAVLRVRLRGFFDVGSSTGVWAIT